MGFQSIWVEIAQSLVVNFVVFRREVELQSFYSAILIPTCACNLHHSSQRCQIPKPLTEARDWTHIFLDTSQVRYCWAMMGTPEKYHLKRTHTQTHTQWDKAQNVKKNNNSFKTNWHSKKYYIIPAI